MSAGAGNEEVLTGRCYTRARRHPGVVGKMPGGGTIPGGPYTLQQLAMMVPAIAGTFGLLYVTRGLWGVFGLGNYAVLLALPAAAGFLASRVHMDGRSPLWVAVSLLGLALRPRSGRQHGRPVRTRGRVRALSGACTLNVAGVASTAAALQAAVRTTAVSASTPVSASASTADGGEQARVASGAAALLARAGGGRS